MKNLKEAAQRLSKMGRGGDTILAHINPEEAELLKELGGSGAVNPHTGLLEFDSDSGGGAGMSGSDGPGTAGSGPGGQGPGGPSGGNDGDNGLGSLGGWSTGGLGLDSFGNVTGPPGFDSPGYSTGQGWGMAAGYGNNPSGDVTGPAGFDAPGFSTSIGNPTNSSPGFGEVNGGFNGALGGFLSGLNTVASFAVPGYAPIGTTISALNGLSALSNGFGLTNTGQLGPSFGDVVGGISSGFSPSAVGGATTTGGVSTTGGVAAADTSPESGGLLGSATAPADAPSGLLGYSADSGGQMMPDSILGDITAQPETIPSGPIKHYYRGRLVG